MSSPKDDMPADQLEDSANYGSRTASGNARLFNCKQCNRAFTREEHLTRHTLLTHNKLKPFVCGICHRPFSRRDLLLRHAKNLHQGSERAVSRIRKLYKRSSRDARDDDDDHDHDHEPEALQPLYLLLQQHQLQNSQQSQQNHQQSQQNHLQNLQNLPPLLAQPLHHLQPLQHQLQPLLAISHHSHSMTVHPSSIDRHSLMNHQAGTAPLHLGLQDIPPHLGAIPMHSPHSHLLQLHHQPKQTGTDTQISDIRLSSVKEGYDTPEKKRLKMSVNMLVS